MRYLVLPHKVQKLQVNIVPYNIEFAKVGALSYIMANGAKRIKGDILLMFKHLGPVRESEFRNSIFKAFQKQYFSKLQCFVQGDRKSHQH